MNGLDSEQEEDMVERRVYDSEIENMSRDDLDALQLRKLRTMLMHVARTNPFYGRLWREAGVDVEKVRTLADLRQLPMVEKSLFVADQNAHPPFGTRLGSLLQPDHSANIYTSSGTSGQGTELHAQSVRELLEMERMYGYYFTWAGMRPGDAVLLTIPVTMLAGGRVEYQGAVGQGLTVLPVGNYDGPRKVQHIDRFRPRALFGSSSYFAHMATLMDRPARESSIEVLLTGMEGASLSFLNGLEETWGATVAERFGCAQMRADFMFTDESGIGGPDRPGILFNIDPFVLLEVLDPATGLPVQDGEFGELVVTSLYHFDNPVVRNRLHDGGVFRKGGLLPGGRSFHGVEVGSIGRVDDVKKVKGINLYPQALDDLVFSWPEVAQYEVVITSQGFSDVITLRVQPKTGAAGQLAPDFEERAMQALKERMGVSFALEICQNIPVSDYKARRWHDLRGQ